MKFLYISLFCLISFHPLFSQDSNINILHELQDIPPEKIDSVYYEIFREYFNAGDYNKAIEFANRVYYSAIANRNELYEEKALYAKGLSYYKHQH